jgi:hypothetical protein
MRQRVLTERIIDPTRPARAMGADLAEGFVAAALERLGTRAAVDVAGADASIALISLVARAWAVRGIVR